VNPASTDTHFKHIYIYIYIYIYVCVYYIMERIYDLLFCSRSSSLFPDDRGRKFLRDVCLLFDVTSEMIVLFVVTVAVRSSVTSKI
jgi:hypothetical protein